MAALIVGIWVVLSSPASGLEAGVASVDVTPEEPVPVTGGLGKPKPTTEIKGRLEVRALVLADGDTRVAIVSVPFIGFPAALIDQVRAEVKSVPGPNIMVGSTHTHSAPDMYGFLDEDGECTADLEYVKQACRATVKAIEAAAADLSPVSLKVATDEAAERIAYNYYAPEL